MIYKATYVLHALPRRCAGMGVGVGVGVGTRASFCHPNNPYPTATPTDGVPWVRLEW